MSEVRQVPWRITGQEMDVSEIEVSHERIEALKRFLRDHEDLAYWLGVAPFVLVAVIITLASMAALDTVGGCDSNEPMDMHTAVLCLSPLLPDDMPVIIAHDPIKQDDIDLAEKIRQIQAGEIRVLDQAYLQSSGEPARRCAGPGSYVEC